MLRRIAGTTLVLLLLARFAVAAEPIQPAPGLPATSPWDLKALSEAPKVEWIDRTSPVRSLYYTGDRFEGKPTRVFAWYATPGTLAGDPSKDSKLPAVVLVHGGGGTAFREWAELWAKRGYAAIAMDLAGNRPGEGNQRTRLVDAGPDQTDDVKFGRLDQPVTENWPYHAVGNVIRAHSLIQSFPEVDANRTAVTGISWGGYLTCLVASLDSRFKAAVPVYGCGFLHENSVWLNRFAKMSEAERARWVQLYDPSRYLPACRVPIFFVNGTNDFAYPLDSYSRSYAVVPGAKSIRVTVNMPHGHPQGWAPREIGAFIDQKLLGAVELPVVEACKTAADKVTAKVTAKTGIKSAALHFTTGNGPINQRSWTTAAADVADGRVMAAAPPAEATIWFMTVTDERDLTTSSPVTIATPPASASAVPVTADPASVGMDAKALEQIPERMREFVKAGKTAGVVTLVARRGKIVHLSAVGEADVDTHAPMRTDSLFAIASMTKPVTATALMILIDAGKVSLDEPASKYIPELKEATVAGQPPQRAITVRDLLTHTSGIPGEQQNLGTIQETAAQMAKRPLAFEPGSKWQYGPGLTFCGRIVEVASGEPFEKFVDTRILRPLKMTETTFFPSPDQQKRLARLYQPGKNGQPFAPGNHWLVDFTTERTPNPSGGLFSTAADLARFYQMILNGGELDGVRILSKKAVDEMTRIHTGELQTGFTPGNGWGLGWCVVREPQGVTSALSPGSCGHGGAFGTQAWIDPKREMTYLLLIQRTGFGSGDGSDIRKSFQETAAAAIRD